MAVIAGGYAMSCYDFFAEFALGEGMSLLKQAVDASGQKYALLQDAPWTLRAQALATGLAGDKTIRELITDGDDKRNIGGYPKLIKDAAPFPPSAPFDITALCAPKPDCLAPLPDGSCLLRVGVKLRRPFTSKDDLAFYPIDNPLKREWVFQTPYLAAAGVKGLLRWAWRMCFDDSEKTPETLLFGPRNDELNDEYGQAGCLYTWPLFWRGKIGLETLNPHDRLSGAGKKPIKYEIVQAGGTADIWLLLLNRRLEDARGCLTKTVPLFLEALCHLLTESGISAKRGADWGTVEVTAAEAWIKDRRARQSTAAESIKGSEEKKFFYDLSAWFDAQCSEHLDGSLSGPMK
jgi:hypothetical protein